MHKIIITQLFLLCSLQIVQAQKGTFIRIYNTDNKKIGKGFYSGTEASSILIYKKKNLIEVPVDKVDHFRTRRSRTHRIVTTVVGVAAVAILVVAMVSNKNGNHNPLRNGVRRRGQDPSRKQIYKLPPRLIIEHEYFKWREQRLVLDTILIPKRYIVN